jgi:hypothetical protein
MLDRQQGEVKMKKLMLLAGMLALIALPALAAQGMVGKNGETVPVTNAPAQGGSTILSDVWYNTTGVLDGAATLGGSDTGWGPYFIATWVNDTGMDVTLTEFGWPCNGGGGTALWYYWLSETLPGAVGTAHVTGLYTIVNPSPDEFPPSTYSYADVSAEGLVVPAGNRIYWGYAVPAPGIGGQVNFNGVVTWAWYLGAWDPDSDWGRTAVLQLKGTTGVIANDNASLSQVKSLFR